MRRARKPCPTASVCAVAALSILAASPPEAAADDYDVYLQRVDNAMPPGSDPLAPDFNDGHYLTYDFMVHVPGDQYVEGRWNSIYIAAQLNGAATFWHHPHGGDLRPPAHWVSLLPALEFDSYFAFGDLIPWYLLDITKLPQFIEVTMADGRTVTGPAEALASRYTFHLPHQLEDVTLHVEGALGDANWGGMHWDFEVEVTITACRGDIDFDRRVDQHDLGLVLASYLTDAGGDADGDGDTDQDDLAIVLENYDTNCEPLP